MKNILVIDDAPNVYDLLKAVKTQIKTGPTPSRVIMNYKDFIYRIKRPKMKLRGKQNKQVYGRKTKKETF